MHRVVCVGIKHQLCCLCESVDLPYFRAWFAGNITDASSETCGGYQTHAWLAEWSTECLSRILGVICWELGSVNRILGSMYQVLLP